MSTCPVGASAPTVTTFAYFGLPDALVSSLRQQGIVHPTPIQAATIPDALAGRDVAAKSPTGSGKTLAFALPLAANVSTGTSKRPRGLVVAPTRELASQIAETLRPLVATRGLKVLTLHGGVGYGPQRTALRRGVDVVVACPGRLEDLMAQGEIALTDVELVVVDEADRMADMGFLPAVRRILDASTSRRQTLLFSATLDGAVDVLVKRYQKDPSRHDVAGAEEELDRVSHRFETVAASHRLAACAELVSGDGSSIVFVRTKHGADRLAKQLARSGVAAAAIHGGRSQPQRERTLARFRGGSLRVLVATDVAARGIHIDDVAQVVHYDLPPDPKDYVHRSGRTARAGAHGSVVALVVPEQQATAVALRRALDLDIGGDVADRPTRPGTGIGHRSGAGGRAGRRRRNPPRSGGPNGHSGAGRAARGAVST